ncbi:3-oxoacyl-ACP reductase FabG [Sporosarcina thermotolerans]|uniref:3-oxoacyl-ACP reductase FabG n=1 Tax=Sporosarcina thermotolerans TaxID=633404 RepID=A0AAW9A9R1_9BACL|nr:3-oxoacyl-ACP reductase FabG [Sporosarcina thermotolerans]MDW0116650.1 3-oxoacyl-ACP reductase FabG [Sporosarcina thermotolerans]WHT48853.1 3-oxoacyl-ACP reductase FabG [Sporosarcina thermotolerans]
MEMKGKTVVITGGANGIGAVAAQLFGKKGAQVAILDYNETAGEALAGEMHAQGMEAAFFKTDVAKRNQVKETAEKVLAHFGKVDVLINNAGITRDAMLLKMEAEIFQQVIDVNLTGVFNCTQAFLPAMIAAGKGKIINTSSIAGTGGNVGQTNYAASKAGVIGMTRTWAKEYGRKGINVNAVAPGFIETDMISTIPGKIITQIKQMTPFARLGKPEDIANAYLFLASGASDFINGTVLEVDGGMLK